MSHRSRLDHVDLSPPLPLGTMTPYGTIEAVVRTGGERYYWMVDGNAVSMIPAFILEPAMETRSTGAPLESPSEAHTGPDDTEQANSGEDCK